MKALIYLSIIYAQIAITQSIGQPPPDFNPPMKIPLVLSGNFGEIRSDHFHSGIDIKTRGTIGHHVFAIKEGYVSRIKVQANGYGKSIYLTHPGGFTSVYGHLNAYREDIASYVRRIQHQRKSHQVDIYLDEGTFPVKSDDFIAYSGNSGSSTGPHLHFEVRTSGNQHPTNALKYGFGIEDVIPPRFHSLVITPGSSDSHLNGSGTWRLFDLVLDNGKYTVPWGTRLEASGTIGIGVEVFDYLNGAGNRCGVYSLDMYVEDTLVYSHVMDEFAFSETRYINAFIEYGERIASGRKIHRLYRLPNDRLRIYKSLRNNGYIKLDPDQVQNVRVVASDVAGNRAELAFTISGRDQIPSEIPEHPGTTIRMKYDKENLHETEDVRVEIPAGALYDDLDFNFQSEPGNQSFLSPVYNIHHPGIPLHKPYNLSIRVREVTPALQDKLLLVTTEGEEIVSAGGAYENGSVVANLLNFGRFFVEMDTIAPEILPLKRDLSASGPGSLRFRISDNLSGIEKYEGFIDNRWALFEYDPKNELLICTFDSTRMKKGEPSELELYITDAKGNISLYHTTFSW